MDGQNGKKTNSNCVPVKSNNNSPNFFMCVSSFMKVRLGQWTNALQKSFLICYLMMITSALKVFLYQIILKS